MGSVVYQSFQVTRGGFMVYTALYGIVDGQSFLALFTATTTLTVGFTIMLMNLYFALRFGQSPLLYYLNTVYH